MKIKERKQAKKSRMKDIDQQRNKRMMVMVALIWIRK